MKQQVLVAGGGGFIGTMLTEHLLDLGYRVRALDTFWFGDYLRSHPELTKIRGDIRDGAVVDSALKGVDTVIQLACLSNDPASDLDPVLTRSINRDGCADIIARAKRQGVKRFIYASSASVYGVRDEPDITEDMVLEPITLYSKYKAEIENVLFDRGSDGFMTVAVRNSTVCGYSKRMRLDTIMGIFVMAALKKGVITIEGGSQLRPLIHMQDLLELYALLMEADDRAIDRQAFNISGDNYRVDAVARMVQTRLPCRLEFKSFTDPRSYHVNTDKAKARLGYATQRPIESSLDEVRSAFEANLIDEHDTRCYSIRHVKHLLATVPGEILLNAAKPG